MATSGDILHVFVIYGGIFNFNVSLLVTADAAS